MTVGRVGAAVAASPDGGGRVDMAFELPWLSFIKHRPKHVFGKHRTPLPDGGRVDVAFELPSWLPWLSFTQADVEDDPGPFGELVVLPWLTHST